MPNLKIPEKTKTSAGNPQTYQQDFINRWKDKKKRLEAVELYFANGKLSIYEYIRVMLMLEGKK